MGFPEAGTVVRPGEILAAKYRVERVLGSGGMGVVVAAHHLDLDERVAIKLLLPHALQSAEAVERFAREARAAVKIKSEHVARVTDVGQLETGQPYMVMEYLEGVDLSAWLRERGPMPVEQAVEFILQACEALAEAHALGIVHRDLKPANLFCVRRADGRLSIKILDFGISKVAVGAGASLGGDVAMTRSNAIIGSPLYMSPEQMRASRDVDRRADIWSLGAIVYELLTGRPPFNASELADLVVLIMTTAPAPIRSFRPDVSPGLERAVLTCLSKDREQRFRDVSELALALAEFAPGPRARGSVESIVRVVQGGPKAPVLSPATERDPNAAASGPQPAMPGAPAATQATWGKTGGSGRPNAAPPAKGTKLLPFALLGAAALLLGVGTIGTVLALRFSSAREAASHPRLEPSKSLAASEPATPPPSADTPPADPAATGAPVVAGSSAPSGSPAAAATSAPGAAANAPAGKAAPATPQCHIVKQTDADGQPHFRRVCN
jgi:serine/threonine-protein kinase